MDATKIACKRLCFQSHKNVLNLVIMGNGINVLSIISLDMDVDLKLTLLFWLVHDIWVASLEIICDKVFLINCLPVKPLIRHIICSYNIVTKNIHKLNIMNGRNVHTTKMKYVFENKFSRWLIWYRLSYIFLCNNFAT